LVLLGWFGFTKMAAQNSNKPQYQTAQVERGTLVSSVTSSGTVSSATSASITTSATGVVSEVYVANGDYVEQGQNIVQLSLDQSSAQKQAAAYASYLSAQNALNTAKSKMNGLQAALFDANQKFVKDKGTTDPDTDDPDYIIERANWLQAESDYNNQQGVISQAEAALSSASLSYSQTAAIITAPISGVVSNLSITQGLPITSSSSNDSSATTPSTQTLGNITLEGAKVTATVNLTEIDVTKVKVGQKVTLTLDAFSDKTFTGKVSAINTNGSVSSGVTSYPTTITFDTAPENIYPNMAVNATIITNVKNDVFLVPTSAVQTQSGMSSVRVLNNDQVTMVSVEIGLSSDTQTEIVSGVAEGQAIIIGAMNIQSPNGTQTSSSFGNTGFGGQRRGGGGGSGPVIRIQKP
jgi:multidrug efflux pump subunit AcrA (membrane-fusion protein)